MLGVECAEWQVVEEPGALDGGGAVVAGLGEVGCSGVDVCFELGGACLDVGDEGGVGAG